MFTSSLSFNSSEDWSYFPSVQLSLLMTMVILITFPPMSAGKVEEIYQLNTNPARLQDHNRKKRT